MNPEPHDVEAFLARQERALEDAGFTEVVMGRIPAKRAGKLVRPAIILAFTAVACVLSLFVLSGPAQLAALARQLLAFPGAGRNLWLILGCMVATAGSFLLGYAVDTE